MILLTPGPVSVNEKVLKSSSYPVIFHRAEPFQELIKELSEKLNVVFGASNKYVSLILNGSGTLANESVITSLLGKDNILMVISNGSFGERLAEIAKIHHVKTVHIKKHWATSFSLSEIKSEIEKNRPYMLAMVALETSTSMLNPVKEIGQLCKSLNVKFFVDAVSALGAEDIKVRRDNIDVCVSVPNKAIESLPGISFVCVKEKILKDLTHVKPNSYSLDLFRYYNWYLNHQTPTTPPVNLYVALDSALDLLSKESLDGRRKRYLYLSNIVRKLSVKVGAKELIKNGRQKATAITSLCFPEEVNIRKLREFLLEEGITVWFNSHQELENYKNMMQVSVMGNIKEKDLNKLFKLIALYKKSL